MTTADIFNQHAEEVASELVRLALEALDERARVEAGRVVLEHLTPDQRMKAALHKANQEAERLRRRSSVV
jgi:hypothetical protein